MKLIKFYIVFVLCVFLFTTTAHADIDSSEEIDFNEIKQEIIETSSNATDIPNINSRAAIVIDRNSKAM